ncbi:hypothetical protein QJQ45_029627 [Haematococcus lacustris]|nr:hypothetical protein QJQ45_029627 [Haematococcus lacustris]
MVQFFTMRFGTMLQKLHWARASPRPSRVKNKPKPAPTGQATPTPTHKQARLVYNTSSSANSSNANTSSAGNSSGDDGSNDDGSASSEGWVGAAASASYAVPGAAGQAAMTFPMLTCAGNMQPQLLQPGTMEDIGQDRRPRLIRLQDGGA